MKCIKCKTIDLINRVQCVQKTDPLKCIQCKPKTDPMRWVQSKPKTQTLWGWPNLNQRLTLRGVSNLNKSLTLWSVTKLRWDDVPRRWWEEVCDVFFFQSPTMETLTETLNSNENMNRTDRVFSALCSLFRYSVFTWYPKDKWTSPKDWQVHFKNLTGYSMESSVWQVKNTNDWNYSK